MTRLASPPPKRCVNSIEKLLFTCSKAVRRRSRPSRFRLAIPLRKVLIASSRSAFSLVSVVEFFLHFFGIFLGPQVHRPQGVALAFEAIHICFKCFCGGHLVRVHIQ